MRGLHKALLPSVPSVDSAKLTAMTFFIHILIYLLIHLANNYFWRIYCMTELGCNLSKPVLLETGLCTFAVQRVCLCVYVHVWSFSQICG